MLCWFEDVTKFPLFSNLQEQDSLDGNNCSSNTIGIFSVDPGNSRFLFTIKLNIRATKAIATTKSFRLKMNVSLLNMSFVQL
jgi:hypothetical protein